MRFLVECIERKKKAYRWKEQYDTYYSNCNQKKERRNSNHLMRDLRVFCSFGKKTSARKIKNEFISGSTMLIKWKHCNNILHLTVILIVVTIIFWNQAWWTWTKEPMTCVVYYSFFKFYCSSGALPSWQSFVIKSSEKSLKSVIFGSCARLFHINASIIVWQNLGHFTHISASTWVE